VVGYQALFFLKKGVDFGGWCLYASSTMNDAKVASVYRQILNASQFYGVDSDEFVNIDFSDINGTAENEVLYIEWQDEVGTDHSVKITEAGLDAANVVNDTLWLIDNEGDVFRLRLFLMQRVPIKVEWDARLDVPLNTVEIGA